MIALIDDEKQFLIKYNIPESKIFDATGFSTWKYREIMKEKGYLVAIGVIPCARKNHRLRGKEVTVYNVILEDLHTRIVIIFMEIFI